MKIGCVLLMFALVIGSSVAEQVEENSEEFDESILGTWIRSPSPPDFLPPAEEAEDRKEPTIGDYVSLGEPDVQGFVRFIDEVSGCQIIALSTDIGSAVPSADLRLYIKREDEYEKMISLPMLKRKGYVCEKQNGLLRIFAVDSYEITKPGKQDRPVLSIDLDELIKMNTNEEMKWAGG